MWTQFLFLTTLLSDTFLPRGRGALALMFGGVIMIGFALVWSLVTNQRTPLVTLQPRPPLSPPMRVPTNERTSKPAPRRPARWLIEAQRHLGAIRILGSAPNECTIELRECPDCRAGTQIRGCAQAQRLLQVAAPSLQIREVTCRRTTRAPCTFELTRGSQ